MISVLQRVCWNTDAWTQPSGETFDSGNPGKHGYGNEEWNFCKDDALDGYVFGFLYWHPAKHLRNEHFEIWFWTISRFRKKRLLIGAYHDASLATESEGRKLDTFFEKKGIYRRRLAEALGRLDRAGQRSHAEKHIPKSALGLRFKCPVEKVEILQPERVLPRIFRGKTIGAYFTNPTILNKPIVISSLSAKKRSEFKYLPSPLLEEVYPRATPASLRMIYPRHKELSNQYCAWLRSNGKTVLGQEKDRVDVEFKDGEHFCRAELKVCYGMTPTHAIREALGQLLEYNYYGWRTLASRWYVVLDTRPSEADISYLRRLAREKLLPLLLCWRSRNDFQVISLNPKSQ